MSLAFRGQHVLTIVQRPKGARLFHQLAIVILATASISYFSMASDLGSTPIRVEFRGEGTRQIWVRVATVYAWWDVLNSHLVCTVHPVVYHLPATSPRAVARHGSLAIRHHDHSLYGCLPRHLRTGWCSRAQRLQVGLLCLRLLCVVLHLVSHLLIGLS